MKPGDLALIRWPSSPTVSPDGARIAFAVNRIDMEADAYRSDLWVVAADGSGPARQLTRSGFDSMPRWSPDGSWLAFRRGGEELSPQLHILPVDGGEAIELTDQPLGVEDIAWSPDGGRIAYIARVPESGRYEKGKDARPPAKEAPRRIDRLEYRVDGIGFLLDRPAHLFVVDPHAAGSAGSAGSQGGDRPGSTQLTRENWGFGSPTWTPDGRHVLVNTDHTADELHMAGDVYAVGVDGGDLRRVTRSTTMVGPIATDGQLVYFLGESLGEGRFDFIARSVGLWSVPFDGSSEPERRTSPEEWDLGDHGAVSHLLFEGQDLLTTTGRRGSVEVVRVVLATDQVEVIGPGRHQLVDFALGGPTLAGVVTGDRSAGEIAVRRDDEWVALTDLGAELARSVPLLPMEEIAGEADDGYQVHGWIVRPPGVGPHPLLLAIHGGPATQYGYKLFDEAQVYASAGYAVLLGNPRGSSGYGEAHTRAIVGDMGNRDRADLLALLDRALEDPALDPTRVGVMGGSYGGYMTTWLAGHDGHRFRAAISERALNVWDSFTGSSDIGWFFSEAYCGADPSAWHEQSPLAHADGIDIPMLIIHSEQDWRCPIEQAQRLFVHLKLRRVPVEMLIFPGEGHELSRSGLPSHRVARFEAILEWWGRHL